MIPATTMILDATAAWLQTVTAAGGSVIMIDSTVQVPGCAVVALEGLSDALTAAVDPDLEISPNSGYRLRASPERGRRHLLHRQHLGHGTGRFGSPHVETRRAERNSMRRSVRQCGPGRQAMRWR